MTGVGKTKWVFPDGDLPEKDPSTGLEAHEALMILNTGDQLAEVALSFYFSDREPIEDVQLQVPAKRVLCFRMDHPGEIGGVELPFRTQYAVQVESSVPVVATFGRLDTASDRMAFYSSAWHAE